MSKPFAALITLERPEREMFCLDMSHEITSLTKRLITWNAPHILHMPAHELTQFLLLVQRRHITVLQQLMSFPTHTTSVVIVTAIVFVAVGSTACVVGRLVSSGFGSSSSCNSGSNEHGGGRRGCRCGARIGSGSGVRSGGVVVVVGCDVVVNGQRGRDGKRRVKRWDGNVWQRRRPIVVDVIRGGGW